MADPAIGTGRTARPQRFSCARHGEHDAIMHATIYSDRPIGNMGQREPAVERRYCMHCYIEHMDKAGVRDMDPVI